MPASPTISPGMTSRSRPCTVRPRRPRTVSAGVAADRARRSTATVSIRRPTISSTSPSWSSRSTGTRRLAHAVAQHRHAVGELEHLVEVVRDVQDRHAALAEAVDHVEQPPHVGAGQRRRRLVEDQQAGAVLPADQGAGDRDRRALRRWQAVHRRLDVEIGEPERGQRLAGAASLAAPADPAAEPGLVAGRDRQVVDRVQRCRRARGPGARSGCRAACAAEPSPSVERRRRSTHACTVAGVGLVVAGEDLDQRRLAGAVLADERVRPRRRRRRC